MITFPNCKINIGLRVTEKRSDGFHTIETVLTPIPWQDILEIIPSEMSETEFKSSGIRVYGSKENNLCFRAYNLLADDFQLPSIKIHLHKILPIGAGLGGGSSDATFSLILLNKIFNLKLTDEKLESYSAKLGSDCPFFLYNKSVLATEKGDHFQPISINLKGLHLVVIKPRVHVNTAEAYSWIKPQRRNSSLVDELKLPISEWKNSIDNDFEKPVFERFPTIRNIKNRLYKLGAIYASMSGSGSSVYGIFEEEKHLNTYFRSSTVWQGKFN